MLGDLDVWRRQMEEEDVAYRAEARVRAKEIRRVEAEGAKLRGAAGKRWDVQGLRAHLLGRLDALTALPALHKEHAEAVPGCSQQMSGSVVECSSSLGQG